MGLTIQAQVRSQTLHPLALLIATRKPYHLLTPDDILRNLHGHHACRPRSARNNHGVLGLQLAHLGQAKVGRQPRQPQRTEIVRLGPVAGKVLGGLEVFGFQHRVLGPVGAAEDCVAFLPVGRLGFNHFGEGAGAHDFAFFHWGHVETVGVGIFGDPDMSLSAGFVDSVEGVR